MRSCWPRRSSLATALGGCRRYTWAIMLAGGALLLAFPVGPSSSQVSENIDYPTLLDPVPVSWTRPDVDSPRADTLTTPPPLVLHGRWEGVIGPVTASYVRRVLEEAARTQAEVVLLELDTPGGLDTAMRDIVKDMFATEIPVIVYVHPAGARAGSAGVFITMAAHVAAMTPGTNIGAAHPVALGGAQMDSVMVEKVTEDASAYARSVAGRHNRNAVWAEQAVRRSVSATAEEAARDNIIDFVAGSVDEVLALAHGRIVTLPQGDRPLHTEGARLEPQPISLRERLLSMLADPNVAYIFMLLGIYGLIFELQNPGVLFPGIIGAISLVLAFMSFQTLPINYAGLALIILALVLFLLEIVITSHGLLAVGGIVSMLLGSLMLIDTVEPAMRVSIEVIIPSVIFTALFFIFAIGMGLRAQKNRVTTGQEGLVGHVGVVKTPLEPTGSILVLGEIWQADSETGDPIPAGDRVEVVRVTGLRLLVRPATVGPFARGA